MPNRRPVPLRIYDSATYSHDIAVYDDDGAGNVTTRDYTNARVTAQFRAARRPDPVLATFAVWNRGLTDPQFRLFLTDADTEGLYDRINTAYPVTERGTRPGDTVAEGRMDIRVEWPDGTVEFLFYARILVYKNVTVAV
ncbi:MAG: hypothetical protein J2P16_00305 [Mycobacterium sp.]|nr:hypothetical protein [Mycobacterium sp.]